MTSLAGLLTSPLSSLKSKWNPISGERTTLNIEGRSLRLLSVVGRRVRRWGSVPLESDLIREGLILDPDRVGTGISALFASQKASKRRVVTSLSGLRALHRTLNLPRIERNLLESLIMQEVRRELASSPEQLQFYWQIIAHSATGYQIYLLGVPQDLLESHVRALQAAKIRATATDLKPLALARAINRNEAIIGNLENECLDIIIVVNYTPILVRSIALGEESPRPADKFHRLIEELERTISFYNDSHLPRNTPTYLTGGLVNLPIPPSIKEGIQTRIKYPLETPEPPLEYPPELPLNRYLVNLGLALKEI